MSDPLSDSRLQRLGWLADAPLFIDQAQVASFYDAVVRPPGRVKQQTYKVSNKLAGELGAKLGLGAEATPGKVIDILAGLFPSLKASINVEGTAAGSIERTKEDEILIESIDTPQRQLVLLTVHFMLNYPDRWFFVDNLAVDKDWRSPESILRTPRGLVFLDLPGLAESDAKGRPRTMLLPMALELEGVGIRPMYQELTAKNGERPPEHPGPAASKAQLQSHWAWFSQHFNAKSALELVEQTAERGKISWIDYRTFLNTDGDTVHLHIRPAGKYDVGTFAYNFIRRGYKHGLRIVGTIKSEPDVNVLAIYEK